MLILKFVSFITNMKMSDLNTTSTSDSSDFKNLNITIDNDSTIELEDILNKIGYTKYHFIMIALVGLTLMADGVELYLMNLLGPSLKHIYNIEDSYVTMIITILFLGIAIGALLSGYLIKQFGRRPPLIFFLLLISISGITSTLVDNIKLFMVCRFFVGISVGMLLNFTNALCEVLPTNYRSFIMGSIYFFLKIGILYFVAIFYLVTTYIDVNNYKLVIFISNIPIYIALIVALLYYRESPRILLWNNNIADAFDQLQHIANGSQYRLSEVDLLCLSKFVKTRDIETIGLLTSIKGLIRDQLRIVILVTILWVMNTFNIFINAYFLPIYLRSATHKDRHDTEVLHKLFVSILIPLPAEIVCGIMTSNKNFGRVKTIIFGFLMQMLLSFAASRDMNHYYIYSSMIIFFNIFSFNITKLYTTEVYSTDIRDLGYGMSNFASRLTAIFIPYLVDITIEWSANIPCYLMTIYSLIGVICAYLLPFDTFGKKLDSVKSIK
jgi:putative MFS transporter